MLEGLLEVGRRGWSGRDDGSRGICVPDGETVRQRLATVMKRRVTDEAVEHVLCFEHERARSRGWCACFPCPAMGKYSALLRYREANDVMLAWMKSKMFR